MCNNSLLLSKNFYITFCRVISQQNGGSDDLRYQVFVIANSTLSYIYSCTIIGVAENIVRMDFGSTCINFNNVYNKL